MQIKVVFFLKLFFIFLGLIYLSLVTYVMVSDGYMPYHEDETINYNAGRLFYETNSLKATYCFYENVSPILGSNWYGFFYNVFYGGIAKIFGFSSKLFIIINVILLLLGFLFLFKMDIGMDKKVQFGIILLLIPNVVYFLFGYWPVIINLTLAISLIYLLLKIDARVRNNENFAQMYYIYTFLCFVYIIVNPLWAIWVLGLLPFFKNKTEFLFNILICGILVFFSFVYIKFFCAPWITGNTSIMFHYLFRFEGFHFVHLIKENFIENIGYFYSQNVLFFSEGKYDNVINQLILLILLLFSPIYYFYTKNRFFLSVSLISIIIFIILITIYTPEFEYFQRILTPIYVLVIFALFSTENLKTKGIVFIFILISFPFSIRNSISNIQSRKQMFSESKGKYKSFISELGLIRYHTNKDKPIIQWVYFEYDIPRAIFFSNLPVSDIKCRPILYTFKINCFNPSDCDKIEGKNKFEKYGKLEVNYALSKNTLDLPNYRLISKNDYYRLYEVR